MIYDYKEKSSKSERTTSKCFLTMLYTVLQFRFKAVMTRRNTFFLKGIKFYSSFCKQSYDGTIQACKKLKEVLYRKKKHISWCICMYNMLILVNDQGWERSCCRPFPRPSSPTAASGLAWLSPACFPPLPASTSCLQEGPALLSLFVMVFQGGRPFLASGHGRLLHVHYSRPIHS